MDISRIKSFPKQFLADNNQCCHESVFRSYQILEAAKEMLHRGDSSETILAFIKYIENEPDVTFCSHV